MNTTSSRRTSAVTRVLSDTTVAVRIGWNWKTYSVDPQLPDRLPTPERAMGHVRTVLVTDDLVTEIEIDGRQYATRLQS